MIFVCLGTKRFSFDRLIKKIDVLVKEEKIKEQVFAQLGHTVYTPKHFKYVRFLSSIEYEKNVQQANIIITHGGTGAIIKGLKAEKQIIGVPRREKFEEHSDDHQLQIVDFFEKNSFILRVDNMDDLLNTIDLIKQKPIRKKFKSEGKVIEIINEFILK